MRNYKLLCVGHDVGLLEPRSTVLTSAGYSARIVTPYWAMMLLRRDHFDAVVLCHTLAQWENRLLRFQIESLGREIAVVQLCSSDQGTTVPQVETCGDSEELLAALKSALERKPGAATA